MEVWVFVYMGLCLLFHHTHFSTPGGTSIKIRTHLTYTLGINTAENKFLYNLVRAFRPHDNAI